MPFGICDRIAARYPRERYAARSGRVCVTSVHGAWSRRGRSVRRSRRCAVGSRSRVSRATTVCNFQRPVRRGARLWLNYPVGRFSILPDQLLGASGFSVAATTRRIPGLALLLRDLRTGGRLLQLAHNYILGRAFARSLSNSSNSDSLSLLRSIG